MASLRWLILLGTVGLVPAALLLTTCYVRIVVVFGLLRSALGTQQLPPAHVTTAIALFMTFFIMAPVGEVAWREGISPLIEGRITEVAAIERTAKPFHDFMIRHTREQDLQLFIDIARIPAPETPEATPYRVLIPSFMLSEIQRAFEIGFLIALPFLIIDLVVAAVLMAMGMMMVPPAIVSLPFKLAFFVIADGWSLIAVALVRGYGA